MIQITRELKSVIIASIWTRGKKYTWYNCRGKNQKTNKLYARPYADNYYWSRTPTAALPRCKRERVITQGRCTTNETAIHGTSEAALPGKRRERIIARWPQAKNGAAINGSGAPRTALPGKRRERIIAWWPQAKNGAAINGRGAPRTALPGNRRERIIARRPNT